ncbi:uracil permease [Virgibacillus sp. MSP4-1]|uniref:solute carrier family 23 protein n=1 Tax=Virgibacillus sp. MSP4-1 TaxID=2700081 RepID=UPI00039C6784|nr:solute carrier family 23 protein [Virgibacillus sp. MSP4-1]QHS22188.1 uracil permease [Virgibacillus sp. MSP4-1]
MRNENMVMDVRDIPKKSRWFILSLQHLFAMFGATILVPLLTEMSQSAALVSSGLGTLAYLFITKGRIPAYLGSSFAFITPITLADAAYGMPGVMVGSFLAGVVYGLISVFIRILGTKWLMNILPPVVVGPIIIVIGLGLAPTAVDMAMNVNGEYSSAHFTVALAALGITILATMFFKGFFGLIPILIGIIGGYVFALTQGIVNTEALSQHWNELVNSGSIAGFFAAFFQVPDFTVPFRDYNPLEVVNAGIFWIMVPIALVTVAEHIGDQMVLSKVAGRNFLEKPGLHRSIMGDGVATMIASFLGGPPNTTYGENIGVLAITRVFSVFVIGGAAVIAILFGFTTSIVLLIESIPAAVMGGVSILLFGIIASSGLRMLVDNQVDLGEKRNLIISSVILVLGIGGAYIQVNENLQIAGMALSAIVGVLLNLVLPGKDKSFGNGNMFEATEEITTDNEAA